MFVIQCQVFRFQYSLAEPDIQFVKVVFAMRLEFGLNIFCKQIQSSQESITTPHYTKNNLKCTHPSPQSRNLHSFRFLPFLITGIRNSWICLLRISLTLSGEMKTAAMDKCNLNGTKLFQVSQEDSSAGWFLFLKHETQRNANCFSIVASLQHLLDKRINHFCFNFLTNPLDHRQFPILQMKYFHIYDHFEPPRDLKIVSQPHNFP